MELGEKIEVVLFRYDSTRDEKPHYETYGEKGVQKHDIRSQKEL